jgi:hypothetical protein
MKSLHILGDAPLCTFCGKEAAVMLFHQESREDITLFLVCEGHWKQFRDEYRPRPEIPDAFKRALPIEEE